MKRRTDRIALPAIAAAGALIAAARSASADFLLTLSSPTVSGTNDVYTLSVLNNGADGSGTGIDAADVVISMDTPFKYIVPDESQDLGDGAGNFDGIKDVNLTGSLHAGVSNSSYTYTVKVDPFGSTKGTFVRLPESALFDDFENGVKDSTQSWSSDANSRVVSSVYSSLTSLEISVFAEENVSDTQATKFVNIVMPQGSSFTLSGSLRASLPGGNSFSQSILMFPPPPPAVPIVLLSATAPTNTGAMVSGTYSPATSPTLTVTRTGPGNYLPGYIHSLVGGPDAGFTAVSGFAGGDVEKFLLKLSAPVEDAVLVADINANNNGTISASMASADPSLANLGGTAWDIELTSTASAPLGTGYFGWNFSGDTNANGITVTDVAAIPEPASAGLLMIGAMGLLARRRIGNR